MISRGRIVDYYNREIEAKRKTLKKKKIFWTSRRFANAVSF